MRLPPTGARRARFEHLEQRKVLTAGALPVDESPEAGQAAGAGDAPVVLFIRGADRSGGFLEAGNDASRTEQLADIFNASTSNGNHGWNELRLTLEAAGFVVAQMTESVESGAAATGPTEGRHIDFELLDLSVYDAIVFGSNNAVYDTAAVDAVEAYVRGGGSTLFISDANFGGDWADASNSDQQFLDRFGLIAHQDRGTYALTRADGDFVVPDHPIFSGENPTSGAIGGVVDAFDGEGVTPIRLGTPPAGDTLTLLAGAEGQTRLNEPPFGNNNIGDSRSADPATDAVLVVGAAGQGKVAGHFDRNTFFNQNGAGTNINRLDNQQYALNLFGFLVGAFDPLPGDYDGSGLVDGADYLAWRAAYGATGANPADGNGDGLVNAADYTVWRDNLGASLPNVDLTLPQPATALSAPVISDNPATLAFALAPTTEAAAPSAPRYTPLNAAESGDADLLYLAADALDAGFESYADEDLPERPLETDSSANRDDEDAASLGVAVG